MQGELLMAAYFAFFALTHSILTGLGAKDLARRHLGRVADRWYRMAFVILAFIAVLPMFIILIEAPGRTLYSIQPPWLWLMVAGQLLAAASALAALVQTGLSQFLGLSQVSGKEPLLNPGQPQNLVTEGFYCHVRNPLFLFGAIFIWLTPYMTTPLLVLYLAITIYFYLGARHEEKLLQLEFGQAYLDYCRRTPAFLPRIRCKERVNKV
jgi:methanethiol S-methyltransferase